jgi:hypothetical protein
VGFTVKRQNIKPQRYNINRKRQILNIKDGKEGFVSKAKSFGKTSRSLCGFVLGLISQRIYR